MRLPWHLVPALALVACSVGPAAPTGGGDGGGSAQDGGPTDGRTGPMWVDAALGGDGGANDCKPLVANVGDGQHNTGRNCMDSCHNHGFTLAGTVYTGAANNTGYSGATITVRDSNNATFNIVVQANGNFYTSQPMAFPVIVMASACPYSAKMVAQVANGSCNTAACHAQQNGAAGQIHLP